MLETPFALIFMLAAGAGPNGDDANDAIVDGIRLWSEIRYRHPAVALGKVDWDRALIETIPLLHKAHSRSDEQQALQTMLARLDDPLTRMRGAAFVAQRFETFEVQQTADDSLVVVIRPLYGFGDLDREMNKLKDKLLTARKLIVDFRHQPPLWSTPTLTAADVLEAMGPFIVPPEITIPPTAVVERRGLRDQLSHLSDSEIHWITKPEVVAHSRASDRRVVMIVDSSFPVPPIVLGLIHARRAQMVAVGPIQTGLSSYYEFPVGKELRAMIAPRVILASEWQPDVQLGPEQDAEALPTALRLLAAPLPSPQASRHEPVNQLTAEPLDRVYADAHPPNVGQRMLALARIWSAVHFFYPYVDLLDSNWNEVLAEFVPRMLSADTDAAYARTLLELSARINDGHTALWGPAIEEVIGPGWLPFELMALDEGWTVVEVHAAGLPIKTGEVLRRIDGTRFEDRVRSMLPLCAASTPTAHRRQAAMLALTGSSNSTAELEVWNGKQTRKLDIQRHWQARPPEKPAFRLIGDGIGYVDLSSLEVAEVPLMISSLRKAPAIIFDMRGYPHPTEPDIAPWLNRFHAATGSLGRERWVVGDAPNGQVTWSYSVPLPLTADSEDPYQGRVVMLIDERAASAAEDTALFFEAATDVLFVGSPTAGTDGRVTHVSLPGSIFLRLTGIDFRHSDGRQLQRLGIQPDIFIRPTSSGLRAGRDEVLERALLAIKRGERKQVARKRALVE